MFLNITQSAHTHNTEIWEVTLAGKCFQASRDEKLILLKLMFGKTKDKKSGIKHLGGCCHRKISNDNVVRCSQMLLFPPRSIELSKFFFNNSILLFLYHNCFPTYFFIHLLLPCGVNVMEWLWNVFQCLTALWDDNRMNRFTPFVPFIPYNEPEATVKVLV